MQMCRKLELVRDPGVDSGWHPFAKRSGAKGWFANRSAIPFGCAEKAATHREAKHGQSKFVRATHGVFRQQPPSGSRDG